jgi:hypothetical protein
MARFPLQTTLPGLSNVVVNLTSNGTGEFTDRSGNLRQLQYGGDLHGVDPYLTITVDDESFCSFTPWPEYPAFWTASGLIVNTRRQGFASAMYACAKQVLAARGMQIAPSERVTDDGKELWAYLDSNVKWEWVAHQGCSRPDLTEVQPPP